jgi:hypothetical protein
MGNLGPLAAAATEAIRRVLTDAYPMPLSTPQVEEQTGYGIRYGQLCYRMLCRLVARGEAEKISVEDSRCRYWRLEPAAAPPGDVVLVPSRRPGPRPASCETRDVRIRIYGRRQIEIFEAMCALAGRAPYELAYDLVLDAIRAGQRDHETQHLAALVGQATLIFGGPRSAAGRREMLDLLRDDTERDGMTAGGELA